MRLIKLREEDGAMAMAVDEAILKARSKGLVPDTCRLFVFKPSTVTIGYFQSYAEEIYDENRRKVGIDAVRRITGGGAVYHDQQGEITYSIVMGEDTLNKKIPESYGFLCQPIIEALDILGIKSEFKPINDILTNGKKISGSAQTRKWGAVLQHGTLMYNTNIDELFSVLNVSKAKIADKILDSIKDRVTTVKQEIGDISRKEVEKAMIEGYRRVFGELEEDELTAEEIEMAEEFRESKYATDEWLNQK